MYAGTRIKSAEGAVLLYVRDDVNAEVEKGYGGAI
jgi:hypothetical protein